jgi:hypothetical protein
VVAVRGLPAAVARLGRRQPLRDDLRGVSPHRLRTAQLSRGPLAPAQLEPPPEGATRGSGIATRLPRPARLAAVADPKRQGTDHGEVPEPRTRTPDQRRASHDRAALALAVVTSGSLPRSARCARASYRKWARPAAQVPEI